MNSRTLGELAVRFGCELRGDPEARVSSVGTLADAGPGQLAFFANPRLRAQLRATLATAVLADSRSAGDCPVAVLVARNPHAVFARMASWLYPPTPFQAGVHPSAVVDPDASLAVGAGVGPLAVVGPGCRIGARSWVGPSCMLGRDVVLGADVRLVGRVTLGDGVVIGDRTIAHPGAVIGSDGFGYAGENGAWIKVPQVGTVRIGADVEIGSNTTIDRGAIGDTVIAEGVKLDNQIQIGHNVRIGAHTAIAGCVGIAGSATIGARCQLAGDAGVAGHVNICDDVVVMARSLVGADITEPGIYSNALTVEKLGDWRRIAVRIRQLDTLARRVRALEGGAPRADAAARSDVSEEQS